MTKKEWCEHVILEKVLCNNIYFLENCCPSIFHTNGDEETVINCDESKWNFCPICGAKRPENEY